MNSVLVICAERFILVPMSRLDRRKYSSSDAKPVSPLFSHQPEGTEEKNPLQQEDFWQKAIIFCFHLLLFTVPLIFTWFNEELFEFNKMYLTYGVTAVIAGLWLR